MSRRFALRAVAVLLLALGTREAFAYRPFDGTDAAVAEPGEFELEAGPVGLRREDSQRTLIAPAIVANYGLAPNWEAVLQGQAEFPYAPQRERGSLRDDAIFLKGVLREGVLQGKTGPSIATEFGALLPDVHGETGTGASLAAIVSQRWSWLTAHFNLQAALARDHEPDYFLGTIAEGPFAWPVRPVGEVFFERHDASAENTVSGLVGAIWQAQDNLAFDVGLREARTAGRPVSEIRLGFTIGFQ